MLRAQLGDIVIIHYRLSFIDGRVHGETSPSEPIKVQLGTKFLVPGVEEAIIGMVPGEKKTITIPCDKAYGPRFNELIATVPKSYIPGHIQTAVGSRVEITLEDGKKVVARVINETPEEVSLDANPPQAGRDLVLFVELVGFD
jgi:peptidylprolyl isomerase